MSIVIRLDVSRQPQEQSGWIWAWFSMAGFMDDRRLLLDKLRLWVMDYENVTWIQSMHAEELKELINICA